MLCYSTVFEKYKILHEIYLKNKNSRGLLYYKCWYVNRGGLINNTQLCSHLYLLSLAVEAENATRKLTHSFLCFFVFQLELMKDNFHVCVTLLCH